MNNLGNRRKVVLSLTVALGVVVWVSFPPFASVVGLAGVAVIGVVGFYRRENHLAMILMFAFLIRLLLILLDASAGLVPDPPIASGHDARLRVLADAWLNGEFTGVLNFDRKRTPVAYVLAPFYILLGESAVSGRVGIATCSLLIGYLVYRLAIRFTTKSRALVAVLLTLLWPSVLRSSVVIQREVLVVISLLAFLWALTDWVRRESLTPVSVIVLTLSVGMLALLRTQNLVLVIAAVTVALVIRSQHVQRSTILATVILVAAGSFFLLNPGILFPYRGDFLTPELLDRYAHGRAKGGAAYLTHFHYERWIDVILAMPIKVCYYLFTPFPWQVRGPVELIAGLSGWGIAAALVFARGGVVRAVKRSNVAYILLAILAMGIVTYAIVEMNYGAAFRRRIQFVPLIIIFASIGAPTIRIHWKNTSSKEDPAAT